MTKREALVEARRRWGQSGNVQHKLRAPLQPEREHALTVWKAVGGWPKSKAARDYFRVYAHRWLSYKCTVGMVESLHIDFFVVKGSGDTWEAAFADADRHTQREEKKP